MSLESFENKKDNVSVEFQDEGNLVTIKGSLENLLDFAVKIINNLDSNNRFNEEELKKYLMNKEELRPGGVFAIFFDNRKNELKIQNRNARGYKPINDQLKKAVADSL